ncbi:hypothetical protein HPB50_029184 [Hyalomma asiaticum]|nr:hypothetical protein HPB50_029184 [Hyalomma asiaticum]
MRERHTHTASEPHAHPRALCSVKLTQRRRNRTPDPCSHADDSPHRSRVGSQARTERKGALPTHSRLLDIQAYPYLRLLSTEKERINQPISKVYKTALGLTHSTSTSHLLSLGLDSPGRVFRGTSLSTDTTPSWKQERRLDSRSHPPLRFTI